MYVSDSSNTHHKHSPNTLKYFQLKPQQVLCNIDQEGECWLRLLPALDIFERVVLLGSIKTGMKQKTLVIMFYVFQVFSFLYARYFKKTKCFGNNNLEWRGRGCSHEALKIVQLKLLQSLRVCKLMILQVDSWVSHRGLAGLLVVEPALTDFLKYKLRSDISYKQTKHRKENISWLHGHHREYVSQVRELCCSRELCCFSLAHQLFPQGMDHPSNLSKDSSR